MAWIQNTKLCAAVACAVLALLAPAASAGVIFYTSEAAFLAAISSPSVDTFDDLPLNFVSSPITRTVASYGYEAAAFGDFYNFGSGSDIFLSTNVAYTDIIFSSFTGGVFGAGAYFFAADFDGNLIPGTAINVSVTDSSGTYSSSIVATSTTSFLGWVSDLGLLSFSVSVGEAPVNAWLTVNDLVLGGSTEIPEPSTVALSVLGLLVLGFTRLRKKR